MIMQNTTRDTLVVRNLGILEYEKAWNLQQYLHKARLNNHIADTILLLEHHPVITLGTRGKKTDLLVNEKTLQNHGVSLHRSTRGGQATLHAPGQLIGYFIFNLHGFERKIREFVSGVETSLMQTLKQYGIPSDVKKDHPGVWTQAGKIASVGIAIKDAITIHGFALNCSLDLSLYSLLSPCGLQPTDMCSIQTILAPDSPPSMQQLKQDYIDHGLSAFSYTQIITDCRN